MKSPKTLLVDGHYCLHRCLHMPDLSVMKSFSGVPTGGIFGFFNTLNKALDLYPSVNRVVVVWDNDRSVRRLRILPEYKANRDPKNEEERLEKEKYGRSFSYQVNLLKMALPHFGVRQAALNGMEGDDVIGLIVGLFEEEKKVILTEDKDMLQLVDENTSVYRPIAEEEVNEDNFQAKTGALNTKVFTVAKSILGDKSDNIPGVPGVGAKTVSDLTEVVNEQVTGESMEAIVEMFIGACGLMPLTKKKAMLSRFAKVYRSDSHILRNLSLIDISREDADEGQVGILEEFVGGGEVRFNRDAALKFFADLDFQSMIKFFPRFDALYSILR